MKQVVQHNRRGDIGVLNVPKPALRPGFVLVRTRWSVISAGTERASVTSRKSSLLDRVRKNPDLVAKVLEQVRQYGLSATIRRVRGRLESWTALGYSASGTVVAVGERVTGVQPGDLVACAGAGYASHAQYMVVPKNLCAKVPRGVDPSDAAYGTIGAIALQGVRQAEPALGETVVVIGLGLIGQITVQLLKAAGCRVVGIDVDPEAVKLAILSGADAALHRTNEDVGKVVQALTQGRGADAVVITAATPSDDPVKLAGELCRERGRVVLVGDVGLHLPRGPYYMKELEFRMSRSYGPGRYDPAYEEQGHDYPAGYVRWTENRNIQEFLRLLKTKAVDVARLTTHRFSIDDAPAAYALLSGSRKRGRERYVGVLLEYPQETSPEEESDRMTSTGKPDAMPSAASLTLGFLGAGSFAQASLLPPLRGYPGARMSVVCTGNGLNAANVARTFGFDKATTEAKEVLANAAIGTVFIATRHNLHAPYTIQALEAGKHVFVEKPLALNDAELSDIITEYRKAQKKRAVRVMVGFNRRFAPLVQEMKKFFRTAVGPYVMNYRINAGFLPATHWTLDPLEGGGRVIGEVCHFVDLLQYVCDASPVSVFAEPLGIGVTSPMDDDSVIVTVRFGNGSIGTITYAANGDSSVPKEHLEVFSTGRTAILDNFKALTLHQQGSVRTVRRSTIDKGHREEVLQFLSALETGSEAPIPFDELVATTRTTFRILDSLRLAVPVKV